MLANGQRQVCCLSTAAPNAHLRELSEGRRVVGRPHNVPLCPAVDVHLERRAVLDVLVHNIVEGDEARLLAACCGGRSKGFLEFCRCDQELE